MVTPVEVNGTLNVAVQQMNDSLFTIILALATLAVAIITGIGLYKTNKRTRESNELLALELQAKFRPAFDFKDRRIDPIPDTDDIWEYACTMWNVGNVSISNISIYHYEYQSLPSINDIIKNKDEIKKTLFRKIESTLEPEHYHSIIFSLKRDRNQDLRIVIWLEYEYLHYKAESIIFLDHYSGNATGYAWFDNDYIQNKRDEFEV